MATAVLSRSRAARPFSGAADRLRRLTRGRPEDPPWVRPSLLAIAAASAVLLIWGLSRVGYGNDYYAAAAVAGSHSWKAFFFGSFDAGNFITVDKPPMALWLMDISARIFGVNSWSLMLPEALCGVAAILLTYAAVRRVFGAVPGLLAASALALTPIAVAIFRFDNPDALLSLLLVAAGWALIRALDDGRTRWVALSAACMGMAFNTKFLQADILLPALFLTFMVAAPGRLRRRVAQMGVAAGVLVVTSGWWMFIVDLIPASSRPWIGGSTNNSVLDLVLGYNGIGRITGSSNNQANFGGTTGILRIVNDQIGGQIAWLVPLAIVGMGAGLWARRRAPRTDLARAGYIFFGAWMLTHALLFDYASGIFHPYYTVAMAPAVAALVGGGSVELWRMRRTSVIAGGVLGASVAGTALLADILLSRTSGSFVPWLGGSVLVGGVIAGIAVAIPARLVRIRGLQASVAGLAAAVVLAGPVAYSLYTVVNGSTMGLAGPQVAGAIGGGGGAGGAAPGDPPAFGIPAGTAGGPPAGGVAGGPPSGPGTASAAAPAGGGGGTVDATLVSYLEAHKGSATWIVAVSSSMSGGTIELQTGDAVLSMGGFNGQDPAMTVARLQELITSGQLRYVLVDGQGGGGGGGGGGGSTTSAVTAWVTAHGTAVTGTGSSSATLYDLQGAA